MRLCRSFWPGKTRTRKKRHVKNHGNVSTKMAVKSRILRLSSNCFHAIFYLLVFTHTNYFEYAPSITSNAALLGGSNITNNDTADYVLNESTTQPSDYNTVQPILISGPLPLSGRLPTPATDGKIF